MLIEFTAGNFLSFNDPVRLSMVASSIKEHEDTHVINDRSLRLFRTSAVYGANASGKSNLIKAMKFMKWLISSSSVLSSNNEKIHDNCFKLNSSTENGASYFEVIFMYEGMKYRYGFEVDRDKIINEWLFYISKSRETKFFIREGNKLDLGNSLKKYKIDKIKEKSLFLNILNQLEDEMANNVVKWFNKLIFFDKLSEDLNQSFSRTFFCDFLKNKSHEEQSKIFKKCLSFLKKADISIEYIEAKRENVDINSLPANMPEELKQVLLQGQPLSLSLSTLHTKYNNEKKQDGQARLNFDSEESEGTQKLFYLFLPIYFLAEGNILIVDELEAHLHPIITRELIKLFNSEVNKGQVIFTTHDTNLLDKDLLRRDQIWFTEKNIYGETDLYSLVELKIRNDASFGKDYIQGKYGAVPYIGDLSSYLESDDGKR